MSYRLKTNKFKPCNIFAVYRESKKVSKLITDETKPLSRGAILSVKSSALGTLFTAATHNQLHPYDTIPKTRTQNSIFSTLTFKTALQFEF